MSHGSAARPRNPPSCPGQVFSPVFWIIPGSVMDDGSPVAWDTLQLAPDDPKARIHLALTKQQLGTLPDFKYGTASIVVGNGQ